MDLEKQFAESMAHFVTVQEWEGYKRGVQDVCSVAQPLLDDMLEALRFLRDNYDVADVVDPIITKATGDTQ